MENKKLTEKEKKELVLEKSRWQNFRKTVQKIGYAEAVAALNGKSEIKIVAK